MILILFQLNIDHQALLKIIFQVLKHVKDADYNRRYVKSKHVFLKHHLQIYYIKILLY